MLEVSLAEPLPLMKELNALKRSKGLRDPSTATSVRRSPVVEAPSSTAPVSHPSPQEVCDDSMMNKHSGFGGSGRRDGIRGGHRPKKGSLRSPEPPGSGSFHEWDFPAESFMELEASLPDFHRQREELKFHLEKLGILGHNDEPAEQAIGAKTLLHNWRTSPVGEEDGRDDDEDIEGSFNIENYEEEVSPDIRNWLEAARDDGSARGEFHEGYGRGGYGKPKSSHGLSRTPVKGQSSRPNAPTLSPLVLNSHDQELHRMGHSRALFTLEEPYEEEEEYFDDEGGSDFNAALNAASFKGGPTPYPPYGPGSGSKARRLAGRRHSPLSSSKHGHIHSGLSSVRSSARPGPWEGEFLDYEVNSVDTNRKESGRGHYRSRPQKPHKYYSLGQEAVILQDPRKVPRRKSGALIGRQLMLQQQSGSSLQLQRNCEAEPLPLLTELEDFNESEENLTSSFDGDGVRLSKRGEIGFENLNSSVDTHGRTLVRVEGNQHLQLAFPKCKELAIYDYKPRNLSQKYRPKAFEEVVGQHIVTQALSNAILRGKIAPVYLFQGSRGTGKTSAARIFAAALLCTSSEDKRPCGICRECITVSTGKCSTVKEVDAASNNGIEKVKVLLEETISAPPLSRYKVFIIDECHVLTTETWNALLKILEEPPMNVVFILITTDPDRLPRTAVSRCQKFPFPKIKESEITKRLQQLADSENFIVDTETLRLIASRSDGSLRDAETTLDQLSLLGQDINSSTVYELVGSASDDRMLSLLDSALLADTVGTVRRARELVDAGVEPLSLMSRLATLITDILAGSFKFTESQRKGFFKKQTLSEEKLEWLRMAMKTLSEAEKQLRVSNDRATWLTAALLQLGPDRSCMFPASCAGTSVTQSPVALDDMGENEAGDLEHTSSGRQTWEDDANHGQNSSEMVPSKLDISTDHRHQDPWTMGRGAQDMKGQRKPPSHDRNSRFSPHLSHASEKQPYDGDLSDDFVEDMNSGQMLSSSKLDEIWCRVVEKCSLPLRQLLTAHAKLISISMSEVDAVIQLEVSHPEHKAKCERSLKTIASIFKSVLGFQVDVKVSLASLPAESEQGTRSWTPLRNYQEDSEAGKVTNVVPKKSVQTKGYSLSHWKHLANQSEQTECFPAIPQASFGSPVKDSRCHDQGTMAWTNRKLPPLSNDGCHPLSNTAVEDPSVHFRLNEARRVSPHVTPAAGMEGIRRRYFPGGPESVNGCMDNVEYDDNDSNFSDGEGHNKMVSPEPNIVNRTVHGDADSQYFDGRRSCDTEAQKGKGGSLKMVRRLTMRSRTRSLPSSNPNSPDDRGSSRFAMKGHANGPKHRDGHVSGDEDASDFTSMAGNLKKSKFKGAAGSFARFFKGSKEKNEDKQQK